MGAAQYDRPLKSRPLPNGFLWSAIVLAITVFAIAVFREGLFNIASHWQQEEYSHGYLIPVISLLLAWQQRDRLSQLKPRGSWSGLLTVAGGILLAVAGELSTLYVIIHFAFMVTLVGLILALLGWRGLKVLWVPLVYLMFMIPVPDLLFNRLSLELQLISSQWGVAIIRLLGISVFLDGNVIDLGTYKLLVVEACSGLRYLFPLMSFGFIVAYLFKIPVWQKVLVFVSTIPLTIIMNSLRIGVIGVLVEYRGVEMAQGFLHDFEGWAIFMACVVVLLFEVWLLTFLIRPRPGLGTLLRHDILDVMPSKPLSMRGRPPLQSFVAVGLLIVAMAVPALAGEREVSDPERRSFATFPLKIDDWYGERGLLDKTVIAAIKVDDFIVANYRRLWDSWPVNLYVAYYASQRKGASAHSPEACLPGGGWEIVDIREHEIAIGGEGTGSMVINRAIIRKGLKRQLVYYWFQERGRTLQSSLAVKWYLLLDALTKNRTDGSLIRLMTFIPEGGDIAEGDGRLTKYFQSLGPRLKPYLPS